MHTKSKRNPIVAHWELETEIIVFLINEGLNRECCHGNKIFDILEFLSSCFLTLFWTGGKFAPLPAGFFNTAQKPLSVGAETLSLLVLTYNTPFQIAFDYLGP